MFRLVATICLATLAFSQEPAAKPDKPARVIKAYELLAKAEQSTDAAAVRDAISQVDKLLPFIQSGDDRKNIIQRLDAQRSHADELGKAEKEAELARKAERNAAILAALTPEERETVKRLADAAHGVIGELKDYHVGQFGLAGRDVWKSEMTFATDEVWARYIWTTKRTIDVRKYKVVGGQAQWYTEAVDDGLDQHQSETFIIRGLPPPEKRGETLLTIATPIETTFDKRTGKTVLQIIPDKIVAGVKAELENRRATPGR